MAAEGRDFGDFLVFRKRLQPADLDQYTMAYQPEFTEDGTQCFRSGGISAIYG
jgi:hypothetical protein